MRREDSGVDFAPCFILWFCVQVSGFDFVVGDVDQTHVEAQVGVGLNGLESCDAVGHLVGDDYLA